jgi:hypothetical protein
MVDILVSRFDLRIYLSRRTYVDVELVVLHCEGILAALKAGFEIESPVLAKKKCHQKPRFALGYAHEHTCVKFTGVTTFFPSSTNFERYTKTTLPNPDSPFSNATFV